MIQVKIDNVANYVRQEMDASEGYLFDSDKYAPVAVMPFDKARFRYRDKKYRACQIDAIGVTLENNDIEQYVRYFEHKQIWTGRGEPGDIKHVILGDVYLGKIYVAKEIVFSSEKGKILFGTASLAESSEDALINVFGSFENAAGWANHMFIPVLVSISFMHCKNVKLIDEPLSRQQRRFKERKGETFYKVLDIEPFKQQVRRETQPGETQLQRALHICRGHFATYTEEKPLFGKITGTFWKPMHVRGNAKQGKVVKDYNIITET